MAQNVYLTYLFLISWMSSLIVLALSVASWEQEKKGIEKRFLIRTWCISFEPFPWGLGSFDLRCTWFKNSDAIFRKNVLFFPFLTANTAWFRNNIFAQQRRWDFNFHVGRTIIGRPNFYCEMRGNRLQQTLFFIIHTCISLFSSSMCWLYSWRDEQMAS